MLTADPCCHYVAVLVPDEILADELVVNEPVAAFDSVVQNSPSKSPSLVQSLACFVEALLQTQGLKLGLTDLFLKIWIVHKDERCKFWGRALWNRAVHTHYGHSLYCCQTSLQIDLLYYLNQCQKLAQEYYRQSNTT